MPIWLIEFYGAVDLDATFIVIALMTSPFWIAMIGFPSAPFLRQVAQPWLVVPLFTVILILLLWKSFKAGSMPEIISSVEYEAARNFANHPIAFLILFCNPQIVNLFMGVMIYQKAMRSGFRAPLELIPGWFLGALALTPFCIRLIPRRQTAL